MKSVYSINDLYPNSGANTETTHGETIPEDAERSYYNDNTTTRADGKTVLVDSKNIFIGVGAFLLVLFLLNKME